MRAGSRTGAAIGAAAAVLAASAAIASLVLVGHPEERVAHSGLAGLAADRDGAGGEVPVTTIPAAPAPSTTTTSPSSTTTSTVPDPEALPLVEPRRAGALVLALGDAEVVALSPALTDVAWRVACDDPRWPTPLPMSIEQHAIVRCGGHDVGLDVSTGRRIWKARVTIDAMRVRVGRGVVVVQDDASGVAVHDLSTGRLRWSVPDIGPANVAVSGAGIFAASDRGVHSFDVETGAERWMVPEPSSGLMASDDAVYARANSHVVHRLDPATGEILATSPQDHRALDWSDVVHADGDVVLVMSTTFARTVSAFDAHDLTLRWQFDPGRPVQVAAGHGVMALVDSQGGFVTIHDVRNGGPISLHETSWPHLPLVDETGVYLVVGTDRPTLIHLSHGRETGFGRLCELGPCAQKPDHSP